PQLGRRFTVKPASFDGLILHIGPARPPGNRASIKKLPFTTQAEVSEWHCRLSAQNGPPKEVYWMRWLRMLAIVLSVPAALLLLAVVVSVALSPPGAGRRPAKELGVPHRAVIAHRGASYWAPEATLPAY